MSITPYLYFNGNCAEAFDFYRDVFEGTIIVSERYDNLPSEYNANPDDGDKIMHTTLKVHDGLIMGADKAGSFGPAPAQTGAIALSYSPSSRAEAEKIFSALTSAGGKVMMPLQDTFWGSYFGTCEDRFGVHWLINLDQQK